MDLGLDGRTAVITGGSLEVGMAVATSLAAEEVSIALNGTIIDVDGGITANAR